jgi:hypothetical protein
LILRVLFAGSAFAQKEHAVNAPSKKSKPNPSAAPKSGQYPLIGLDPADVKEAFESIHTKDKDEWAAAFMRVADRYFNEAKSLEKSDPAKGECGLHPRLAALFFRALAHSGVSGQAAIV